MAQTTFGGRLRRNGGYIGVPCEITMDQYWDRCVAAISGQGTNGSTPNPDLTGKSVGWSGGASITTSVSKFYGSSIFIPSGGAVSVANSSAYYVGYKDFTVSLWIRPSSLSTGSFTIQYNPNNPGSDYPPWSLMWYQSLGGFQVTVSSATTPPDFQETFSTPSDFVAAQFSHVCFVKSGFNFYVFINGILRYSKNSSTAIPYSGTNSVSIGSSTIDLCVQDFAYYVGPAIYTSSFVPSTRDMLTSARRYPAGVHSL